MRLQCRNDHGSRYQGEICDLLVVPLSICKFSVEIEARIGLIIAPVTVTNENMRRRHLKMYLTSSAAGTARCCWLCSSWHHPAHRVQGEFKGLS